MHLDFKSLLCLFIITASINVWGQHPVLRNYTVDDGLPSSEIYHVFQDSKGYIWMATNFGVSRFNGVNFQNYDTQDGLPENTIFEIYEDEIGRIWFIGFPFQLSYFQNDSLHPYKYNNLLKKIAGHGSIPSKNTFQVESDGSIIFSFLYNGVINRITKDGLIEALNSANDNLSSINISKLGNRLYAVKNFEHRSDSVRIRWTNSKGSYLIPIDHFRNEDSYGNIYMQMSDEGDLLFSINNSLTIVNKEGKFETFDLKSRILWMSIETDGTVWIGKELSGIEVYSIKNISKGPNAQYLKGESISSVEVDNEGGIWFTSLSSGLYYLPSSAFISYTEEDGLSGRSIQAIELYQDKIFVGSDSYALDVIEKNKISSISEFGKLNKTINVINTFKNNTLWIGAKTILYSYKINQFQKINNNHNALLDNSNTSSLIFSIKDIYPLSSDEVMLAQMQSLSIVRNGKVVYDSYLDDNVILRIEAIERETDSTFLLGTFNGLWRFNGREYQYLGKDSELLRKRTTDVLAIHNGNGFVIGTKGFGLIVKYKGSIIQLTEADGLSSNSITSLLLTGNDIWIATNNGLNVFNINELEYGKPRIKIFRIEHGLVSNEINQIKGDSKFIYIATNNGLTIFDRAKYKPLISPPPVFINGVSIMRRDTVLVNDYYLSYNQNFITINYTGITYRDASKMVYKYRLIGLSDKWIYTKDRQIIYAFLPPGDYRFEVYAINSEGVESSHAAAINIIINLPFWETWWFISIMLVFIALMILVFLAYRTKQLKKRHIIQSELNKYRQQALIRQMDPHFVFNTLNSIQSFIIKNDNLASTQYLSKFSRLMRLILNNSQKQEVRLRDEIDALNLYMELESMRFKHKFEYIINVDSSIDADMCFIPAFILQPFIENSIWHGIMNLNGPGKIMVDIMSDEDQIICTIEDNGIGRSRAMELKSDAGSSNSSMGISIIESRLGLLSGFYKMKLEAVFSDVLSPTNEVIGTKVQVNLPYIS